MFYYLFLDECGDHGLSTIDASFPIFVLCGVLIKHDDYLQLDRKIKALKSEFWGEKKAFLHSRDIRKCEKEFSILLDQNIKASFYLRLNEIIVNERYTIISSCVRKDDFIKKYGKTVDNVYNIAVSHIIERAVFYMDDLPDPKNLQIIIEKRGKSEDQMLSKYLQIVFSQGTYYVSSVRIAALIRNYIFRSKDDDISGLQLADLCAYPIARHLINKDRANPAFDLIRPHFYRKGNIEYGLKVSP